MATSGMQQVACFVHKQMSTWSSVPTASLHVLDFSANGGARVYKVWHDSADVKPVAVILKAMIEEPKKEKDPNKRRSSLTAASINFTADSKAFNIADLREGYAPATPTFKRGCCTRDARQALLPARPTYS